jgi:hypothetical protein
MAGATRGCPGYDTIIQENVRIILKTVGYVEKCVQKAIAPCKVQDGTVKLLGEMLEDLAHRRLLCKFWLGGRRPERGKKSASAMMSCKKRHIVGDLHNVACVDGERPALAAHQTHFMASHVAVDRKLAVDKRDVIEGF